MGRKGPFTVRQAFKHENSKRRAGTDWTWMRGPSCGLMTEVMKGEAGIPKTIPKSKTLVSVFLV